ncbi:hypothetical protein GF395_04270 [Candidatus Uhrbacteria bacterium]|nr:hypothetical protein [Candidatus Uhrbacteria bacterium]
MKSSKETIKHIIFQHPDGRYVDLRDIHRGGHVFLIASGPSTKDMDLTPLKSPGIMTMTMNNSIAAVRTSKKPYFLRPNFWCCVDPPDRFFLSIHRDPAVMKFYPRRFSEKALWDAETYTESRYKVGDCTNIFEFERNNCFNERKWIIEPTLNWGNHKDRYVKDPKTNKKINGKRSVMLPSIKILLMLGFRHIYLVGCDFNMQPDRPYAFDQEKHAGGCKSNNKSYEGLNAFFRLLKPQFDSIGLKIYNTNPKSNLTAFNFIDFQKALDQAFEYYNVRPEKEKARGMYTDLKDKRNMGINAELNLGEFKTKTKYDLNKLVGACTKINIKEVEKENMESEIKLKKEIKIELGEYKVKEKPVEEFLKMLKAA